MFCQLTALSFPWSGASTLIRFENDYGTLDAWREATGQETRSGNLMGSDADPELVSAGSGNALAYQLQDASPSRLVGIDLSQFGIDPGSRDYFGNPLTRDLSIGADNH
jgi:hypothetical protein